MSSTRVMKVTTIESNATHLGNISWTIISAYFAGDLSIPDIHDVRGLENMLLGGICTTRLMRT